MRESLSQRRSVTSAIYAAGFNSSSRFYEDATRLLGMKPTAYQAGGKNVRILYAAADCSLGKILVAASRVGICMIGLADDPELLTSELHDRFPNADLLAGNRAFEKLVDRVVKFVDCPGVGLDLPLDIRGTAFQQRVWQKLTGIPAGQTRSYAQIARSLGKPKAVRAVGSACGANHIAVAIPCHRAVRSNGSLAGYHWGIKRKVQLLKKEAETP
jgi:AraC family transcriptional regulator of adaptative response/methylated-DNA-[protein]-cysteine methyltransferase